MKAAAVLVATGLAAAALLGACGVQSSQPLFTAQDSSNARLREGVWALSGAGCDMGTAPASAPLPECAVAVRVAHGRLTPVGRLAEGDSLKPLDIVLVENRPLILQTSGDGDKAQYYGVRPTASDATGRITRGVGWVLSCPGSKILDQCTVNTPAGVRARADHISPMQSAFLTWIAP